MNDFSRHFNQATQIFQAQATYGYLLDQASCSQSDQFSSSCREKDLVSSSYSSAAELPAAITDRLREQSESPSAAVNFRYNTNYCAL